MDASSLSRLENISQHPLISKGVRAVRVVLHFYDSVLADDIFEFADYNTEKLRFTSGASMSIYKETLLNSITERKAILKSWESFLSDTPDDPACEESLRHRMLLRRGHEEYRRRFTDQQRLQHDGIFVRAVAAAMARMPIAKRLEVYGHDLYFDRVRKILYHEDETDKEIHEALIRQMLILVDWNSARRYELGKPPVKILPELIGAIYGAGVLLTNLTIKLCLPDDLFDLAISKEDLSKLAVATQKLTAFEFRCQEGGHEFWPVKGSFVDIESFLRAILASKSIKYLSLGFSSIYNNLGSMPFFERGSAINLHRWQRLEALHCNSVPFHLADLARFIDRRTTLVKFMRMHLPHLLGGTWAEVLDHLRRLRGTMKHVLIEYASGAECETMSAKEKEAIFDYERPGSISKVQQYLQGLMEHNPLRGPPAEESTEEVNDATETE